MRKFLRKTLLLAGLAATGLQAGAQTAAIKKAADRMLQEKPMQQAHIGISIYEPSTDKYWYRYQDQHFFTPASNMKIFSLYTGMQLLGDSLPAVRYYENDTALFVKGMGDPSFLHPDFTFQPVMVLLQQTKKPVYIVPAVNVNRRYGPGWAWGDFADDYQPETGEWPMYGNVATLYHHLDTNRITPEIYLPVFKAISNDTAKKVITERDERSNQFTLQYPRGAHAAIQAQVPFVTGTVEDLRQRLADTLHKPIGIATAPAGATFTVLRSIPSDSLFVPMMHRSDNLFAEQTMIMCSALLWDTISTARMIDHQLAGPLKDLPHPPQWADGSGLSRYNLFTLRDFVTVLTSLYNTYPKERLWTIFPTGGKGTLKNYYHEQFVHAKTGSLNGCIALSGYLITKKGKTLVFSVIVNNHYDKPMLIRRAVEQFLTTIRNSN